jgi:hypothetical protein
MAVACQEWGQQDDELARLWWGLQGLQSADLVYTTGMSYVGLKVVRNLGVLPAERHVLPCMLCWNSMMPQMTSLVAMCKPELQKTARFSGTYPSQRLPALFCRLCLASLHTCGRGSQCQGPQAWQTHNCKHEHALSIAQQLCTYGQLLIPQLDAPLQPCVIRRNH